MSSENKLYFSHDFYSRDNLSNLRMKCGLEGYGIYWCLVEIMHENGGEIKESDIDGIAYNLHTDASKILEVIENCDTFSSKKGVITSKRVLDNIKKREKISAIRREAVGQRWNKPDESELPEVKIGEDEERVTAAEQQQTVDFYVNNFDKMLNRWLDRATMEQLDGHNVYDYRNLFWGVINAVKDKKYVVVNGQKVPTYRYLEVLCSHIKQNNDISNLDKAIADVESRYEKGLIRNKMQYMIAALYNARNLDTK